MSGRPPKAARRTIWSRSTRRKRPPAAPTLSPSTRRASTPVYYDLVAQASVFDAALLVPGRPQRGSVGSGGAWRYYRLRLTADASNITLVLTKTAGVPGLYVGLGGRPPTRSSYLKVAQAGALTLSGTEVGVPTTLEVGVFSWEEARYSLLAIVEAAPSAAAAAADGACDADKDGVYDKAECDEAAAPAASDAPPPFLPPGALDPTPPARPSRDARTPPSHYQSRPSRRPHRPPTAARAALGRRRDHEERRRQRRPAGVRGGAGHRRGRRRRLRRPPPPSRRRWRCRRWTLGGCAGSPNCGGARRR